MHRNFLASWGLAAGAVCVSSAAFAYMAAMPVPIPAAFERPMSPYAACAAEAQERFLSGAAYDSFVRKCGQAGAENLCKDIAAARKIPGKARTAFARKCVAEIEEAER